MGALAALNGLDPLAVLSQEGVDVMVLHEILRRMNELYVERTTQEIEAMGIAVGNAVGNALARAFGGR